MTTATPSTGFLHLVVGYDGSPPASRALDAAVSLLQGRTGRLEVVYVAHLSSTVMMSAGAIAEMESDFDEIEQELRAQAAEQLRGRVETWELQRRPPRPDRGDRRRELVPRRAPDGRFGRGQSGPPRPGAPGDRAVTPGLAPGFWPGRWSPDELSE